MKRIVCLLIAALSVSLLLGGCGQNSDPLSIREFIIGDSIGTVEQALKPCAYKRSELLKAVTSCLLHNEPTSCLCRQG